MLKYKEFQGSVLYENGQLLIQILHISDTITAFCDKSSDVQMCFEELVDDYLDTCELLGKTPTKPFKGTFNVRVQPEIHKKSVILASEQGATLNSFVEEALKEKISSTNLRSELMQNYVKIIGARSVSKSSSMILESATSDNEAHFYYSLEDEGEKTTSKALRYNQRHTSSRMTEKVH